MTDEEVAQDRSGNLGTRSLLTLLGALVLGVATAAVVMPALFRATPTDISRIGVLLSALRDPHFAPRIAVLGNSVVMSAVDGRRLSAELAGHPLAVNLASTGQSLVESYLLQQELPESVDTVVQLVTLAGSESDERPLDPQKYNTFYMYGFRPSERVRTTLGGIYGPTVTDLLDASDLSQRFQARWAVRQLLDTQLRILLRRDLTLSEAEKDLFHPQRYSVQVGPRQLELSLTIALGHLVGKVSLGDQQRRLLAAMMADSRRRDGLFVVLLPPAHPRVLEAAGDRLAAGLRRFEAELSGRHGVIVVDATRALRADQFIDGLHPTNSGAEVITDLLANRLASAR